MNMLQMTVLKLLLMVLIWIKQVYKIFRGDVGSTDLFLLSVTPGVYGEITIGYL